MIITNVISGLGNQLFQYVLGRQLSINKQVPLKLDTSFFGNQKLRNFKLNHYNIKSEIATNTEVELFLNKYTDQSFSSKIFRKAEKIIPYYRRKVFKEKEWWTYDPNVFKVSSNVYIEGYWQHYKYFENVHPIIFEELTVKEVYSMDTQKILNEVEIDPSSVSLHIRRGDYITDKDANKLMGVLPLSYYNKAVDFIKNNISNPSIYIFSDDLDWAKDNLKTDIPIKLVDIENGTKDYIELDIMSKCKHNIIANSSFSWWGAFLNQNLEKIIIAPKQWVVPDEINSKIQIQFPSWIKF